MDFSLCLLSSYPLCVSVSKFPFSHKDSSHLGSRHILRTLSWWHLQRISFQIMSHSQDPGVRTLTSILEYGKFISLFQSVTPSIPTAHLRAFSTLVKGWSYGTDCSKNNCRRSLSRQSFPAGHSYHPHPRSWAGQGEGKRKAVPGREREDPYPSCSLLGS